MIAADMHLLLAGSRAHSGSLWSFDRTGNPSATQWRLPGPHASRVFFRRTGSFCAPVRELFSPIRELPIPIPQSAPNWRISIKPRPPEGPQEPLENFFGMFIPILIIFGTFV